MRQVGDGLHGLLEELCPDLVEQQGQEDGGGETEDQLIEADQEGVAQQAPEIHARKEVGEMLETHPGAVQDAQAGVRNP